MRVDLAGYVINAVPVEGRSVSEVCDAHDVSRSWLYELIARYREFGDAGLRPQGASVQARGLGVTCSRTSVVLRAFV
jgi:transposase